MFLGEAPRDPFPVQPSAQASILPQGILSALKCKPPDPRFPTGRGIVEGRGLWAGQHGAGLYHCKLQEQWLRLPPHGLPARPAYFSFPN